MTAPQSPLATGTGPTPVDPAAGLRLVVAAVATALPVSGVLVIATDGDAPRVVARHGSIPEDAEHRLARHALRAAATTPGGGAARVRTLPAPFAHAAVARIEDHDGRVRGGLAVLGRDPRRRSSAPERETLAAMASLAALHLPSLAAAGAPGPSSGGLPADLPLRDVLDALPEAIAIFDRDERFVLWNRQFEQVYAAKGVSLQPGLRFEQHLRNSLAHGHVKSAVGREEAWLADRLARFRAADGMQEHQLGDGRWVRVQDRRLPHGGTVGVRFDITALTESERTFRLLFEANPSPMLVVHRESLAILSVNDAAVRFYGYPRDAFLRLTLPDIRVEARPGEIAGHIEQVDDPSVMQELRIHRTAEGEERIVKVHARLLDHAGQPAVLASVFDLTDHRRMEDEVGRARSFLQAVVDQVPTTVFAKDMWDGGRYVVCNRAGQEIIGRPRDSILGHTDAEIFDAANAASFQELDAQSMRTGALATVDQEIRLPDGTCRWVRTRRSVLKDGIAPRYVLGVSEDITESRALDARLAHMAHHDAVTDLPNRFLFRDRLDAALARLGGGDTLAVLCIDLDGFKAVNDAHGHAAGDALLRQASLRLREALRTSDTAARLGGDEFAVLQTPIGQAGETAWLAGRLRAMLSHPYTHEGCEFRVTASIGVAFAQRDGCDPDALLAAADAALYDAKRGGRDRVCFAASGTGTPDGLPRSSFASSSR